MSFTQRLHEIRDGFERPFWVANVSELFERLSYYAAFASLARYLHEALNFPTERAADLDKSPEEAAIAQQRRERLHAVLDAMDLERRAIFVMYELDELSCEAIAEMLSVPVGTVHSRLHAARKAFQAALLRQKAQEAGRGLARRG